MKTIGIDPGVTGAIVLLEAGVPVEWERMPTSTVGSNTRVNCAALAAMLRPWRQAHLFLENVGPMPKQSPNGSFSFGDACGAVRGVVVALEIPMTLVTPMVWKKRAGLIGQDKDAARTRAIQLWPQWRALDKKGEGQALADAALLALYGGKA